MRLSIIIPIIFNIFFITVHTLDVSCSVSWVWIADDKEGEEVVMYVVPNVVSPFVKVISPNLLSFALSYKVTFCSMVVVSKVKEESKDDSKSNEKLEEKGE